MLKLKLHTTRDNRYFIRTLGFNESEIEYTDESFTEVQEIDLKSDKNHLEFTEDGIVLSVVEGRRGAGSDRDRLVDEDVMLIVWHDKKYFPTDMKDFATCLAGYDPMNTGEAYTRLSSGK